MGIWLLLGSASRRTYTEAYTHGVRASVRPNVISSLYRTAFSRRSYPLLLAFVVVSQVRQASAVTSRSNLIFRRVKRRFQNHKSPRIFLRRPRAQPSQLGFSFL